MDKWKIINLFWKDEIEKILFLFFLKEEKKLLPESIHRINIVNSS